MKCSWQYGTTNCIELDKQDKQYALGLNLIRRYKVSWTCILIITILSCIIPYLLKKTGGEFADLNSIPDNEYYI